MEIGDVPRIPADDRQVSHCRPGSLTATAVLLAESRRREHEWGELSRWQWASNGSGEIGDAGEIGDVPRIPAHARQVSRCRPGSLPATAVLLAETRRPEPERGGVVAVAVGQQRFGGKLTQIATAPRSWTPMHPAIDPSNHRR
jgi:hypothetical protein